MHSTTIHQKKLRYFPRKNGIFKDQSLTTAIFFIPAQDIVLITTIPVTDLHIVKSSQNLKINYKARNACFR